MQHAAYRLIRSFVSRDPGKRKFLTTRDQELGCRGQARASVHQLAGEYLNTSRWLLKARRSQSAVTRQINESP